MKRLLMQIAYRIGLFLIMLSLYRLLDHISDTNRLAMILAMTYVFAQLEEQILNWAHRIIRNI